MARPVANEAMLQQLIDMGFDRDASSVALVCVENAGLEHAINWIVEHPGVTSLPKDITAPIPAFDVSLFAPHKLVIVVRQDLKMSIGKVAAQCSHAAVDAALNTDSQRMLSWNAGGQPIIVVQCQSEAELLEVQRTAQSLNVATHPIRDAGRTEVVTGTFTCMGVGPGTSCGFFCAVVTLAYLLTVISPCEPG